MGCGGVHTTNPLSLKQQQLLRLAKSGEAVQRVRSYDLVCRPSRQGVGVGAVQRRGGAGVGRGGRLLDLGAVG